MKAPSFMHVAEVTVSDTEVYSPSVCCVCPWAGVRRVCVEGRDHSRSVSNITEPEVEPGDCVGWERFRQGRLPPSLPPSFSLSLSLSLSLSRSLSLALSLALSLSVPCVCQSPTMCLKYLCQTNASHMRAHTHTHNTGACCMNAAIHSNTMSYFSHPFFIQRYLIFYSLTI